MKGVQKEDPRELSRDAAAAAVLLAKAASSANCAASAACLRTAMDSALTASGLQSSKLKLIADLRYMAGSRHLMSSSSRAMPSRLASRRRCRFQRRLMRFRDRTATVGSVTNKSRRMSILAMELARVTRILSAYGSRDVFEMSSVPILVGTLRVLVGLLVLVLLELLLFLDFIAAAGTTTGASAVSEAKLINLMKFCN